MQVLYFISARADSARDWIVWASAIVGGLATIALGLWHKKSPFRRTVTWLWKRNVSTPAWTQMSQVIVSAVKPDLNALDAKMNELAKDNASQHAEVARSLGQLRADLNAHMQQAVESRVELHDLAVSTDDAVTGIRSDLAEANTGEVPIT